MSDCRNLLEQIKQISVNTMESTQPTDYVFGIVQSTEPLQIVVEQKLILGQNQLVLTRNVTDHEVVVIVEWETEDKSGGSGEQAFSSHNHSIVGEKTMILKQGLVVGDKVVLIKKKGGQQYLVIDKVV